jgi:hypothetical protein
VLDPGQLCSPEEAAAFPDVGVGPEFLGGVGPGVDHPGFLYLRPGAEAIAAAVDAVHGWGHDPAFYRVVEWTGSHSDIESAVRPVASNMQRPDHGRILIWFALRPGGPAVVELSADAGPSAGRIAAAFGDQVLTVVGHLALPLLSDLRGTSRRAAP